MKLRDEETGTIYEATQSAFMGGNYYRLYELSTNSLQLKLNETKQDNPRFISKEYIPEDGEVGEDEDIEALMLGLGMIKERE